MADSNGSAPHADRNGTPPPYPNGIPGDGRDREVMRMVANAMASRAALLSGLLDPRRDVYDSCKLPKTTDLDAALYQELFDREAVPARVVEVFPKESWQVQPTVYEDEDGDTPTEFENAWDALGKQLTDEEDETHHAEEKGSPVWSLCLNADVLSGIGHYGVILLGVDDGAGDLSLPAQPAPGRKLLYAQAYPEAYARVVEYDSNRSSRRFGRPTMYQVTSFGSAESPSLGTAAPVFTQDRVHWTRVIHVADTSHQASPSRTHAAPRMRPVINQLLGLQKLYCADPEMYWLGAFMGLVLTTAPQAGVDVVPDVDAIRETMWRWENGLQRWAGFKNLNAQPLSPQVSDPSPHVQQQLEAICIKLGIPVRVFKGSERGELASSQDDAAWNDRLRERQNNYLTPKVIVPLVNRLIRLGVLPVPPNGYKVWWPDLTSQTQSEKAAVASQKTEALSKYVSGGVEALMAPFDYLTRIVGFEESEAESILENSAEAQAEREQAEIEKQQELIEQGLATDPVAEQQARIKAMEAGAAQTVKTPAEKAGGKAPSKIPEPSANVFCPTGEGGGVDPTCSPGGAKATKMAGRAAAVRAAAEGVEVTEEKIGGGLEVDRDDYDAIEERLTDSEREELQVYLDQDRENYVDSVVEGYDPDLSTDDYHGAAEAAGWDTAGTTEEAINAARKVDPDWDDQPILDWETEQGGVSRWRRKYGEDAVNDLADHLEREGAPPAVVEAVRELTSRARDEVEERAQDIRDEMESEARSQAEDDYDSEPARRDFLRQFYDSNPGRFESAASVERVWGRDSDGDRAYAFTTSAGNQYLIWGRMGTIGGEPSVEVGFSDESGSYAVTGAGGAHEVFGTVTTAVTGLVLKERPPLMSFTAAEPSRQKLYDRLVRTTAAAAPEYQAVAIPLSGGGRRYVLVRRDRMGRFEEIAKTYAANVTPEVLVNANAPQSPDPVKGEDWVLLKPEARPEWFRPESWKDNAPPPPPRGERRKPRKPSNNAIVGPNDRICPDCGAVLNATGTSHFANCKRDAKGHCLPGTGGPASSAPALVPGSKKTREDGDDSDKPTPPKKKAPSAGPDPKEVEAANTLKTLHPNVSLIQTPDGTQWVVKGRSGRGAQVRNEAAATDLAKHAGVDVAPVKPMKLHGQDAIVSEFVEGKALSNMSTAERSAALAKVPKSQLDDHALFDYAIGSKDPNIGNYMIRPDGGMVALDKEQTLGMGQGNKAVFRVPEHLSGEHEFGRENARRMADAAGKMADDLEARGMKKEATGVRKRAKVMRSLADGPNKPTAAELDRLGQLEDQAELAQRGFVGRMLGRFTGNVLTGVLTRNAEGEMKVRLTFDGEFVGDIKTNAQGTLEYDGRDPAMLRNLAHRHGLNLVEIDGRDVNEITSETILQSILDGIQGRFAANEVPDDEPTGNVFCATGPGGGVDPTCSPGGGKRSGPAADPELPAKALAYVQANYDKVKSAYLEKNATRAEDGSIKSITLNVDEWREHIPGYVGTNAGAVQKAAAWCNKKLFAEALEEQKGKGNGKLMILAGGGGSGKGTAVNNHFVQSDYPLIIDQVSDHLGELEEKMEKIRSAGYKPEYVFIDRAPEDAWNEGVVARSLLSRAKGQLARTVPLDIAVPANVAARKTALELLKKHDDIEPRVVDNNRGYGLSELITDRNEAVRFLEANVAKTPDVSTLKDRLRATTEARAASGEIDEDIRAGFLD